MPSFSDLPSELGLRISGYLDAKDAINLSCTARNILELGESRSWRSLKVTSPASHCQEEQVLSEVETIWQGFSAALARRPSRRAQIQSIRCDLTSGSVPLLLELITRPSAVTHVDVNRIYTAEQATPASSFFRSLAFGPSLPHLTFLRIADGLENDDVVFRCLVNTPNLVSLAIWMDGRCGSHVLSRGGTDSQSSDAANATRQKSSVVLHSSLRLHLPRLKKLFFYSCMWLDVAAAIMDHAPEMDTLYIQWMGDAPSGSDPGEEVDPEEQKRRDARMMDVLHCRTIRHFDAESIFSRYIFSTEAGTAAPEDWMPGLKRLISWGMPRPGRMPRHQHLEWLTCWDSKDLGVTHLLGTFPSSTTTGLVAPWLARALEELPSLTRLDVRHDWVAYHSWSTRDPEDRYTDHARPPRGLQMMRFEDPSTGDSLLHARIVRHTGNEESLLGHHHASCEREDLSWDQAFIFHDDYDLNPNGPLVLDPTDPDHDDMEGVLDFTAYRGRPLPKSVLRWLYAESGLDWDWIEGARETRLPDHVWDYLAAWVAVVEESAEHFAGEGEAEEVHAQSEEELVGRPGEIGEEDPVLEETAVSENAHDLESYFGDGLRW